MPITLSPLRYPGGKTKLYRKVVNIIQYNGLNDLTYVEPFVGGAGLAIKLLIEGDVANIVINDIDPAVYAFWHCVLNETDELCSLLTESEISISERDRQIEVLTHTADHSLLEIGFATLYLNRTNVSGILTAGPIGGKGQTGAHRLDARFKKLALLNKIVTIAKQKDKIFLHNCDVIKFIDEILPQYRGNRLFLNLDPPYVKKGQELYLNHFISEDHIRVRDKITECEDYWIVTYDYNPFILNLYSTFSHERMFLNHSAGDMKIGEEIIIYCNNLIVPPTPIAANK